MKLTLRKSSNIDDWYVIERAEHDGRTWIERIDSGALAGTLAVRDSSRFSDADVEGTREEMLAIADAIERHDIVSFKRCAVDARVGEQVRFCSPRNSTEDGCVSLAEADELAAIIRRELKPSKDRQG